LPDSLAALLALADQQKQAVGLADTPREIHQQPETWRGTLQQLEAAHDSVAVMLREAGLFPGGPAEAILAGAGSSAYIGESLSTMLQQGWGVNVRSLPSTDLLASLGDFIRPESRYAMLSFSRSGESSEGIALLQLARLLFPEQIRHIVITCNASGAMARVPDVFPIVLADAVNDRGLAMTSSFTNMVIAGQYLAHIHCPQVYRSLLNSMAEMGERLLPKAADTAARLAEQGFQRVCFLGSGALQAVARESALKVLELNAGRIPTMSESFLGLRHGPMSFLNRETLVCAFLSGEEPRFLYERDLLREIHTKRLAGDLLLVTPRDRAELRETGGRVLNLGAPQDFPDACRPPVDVIVGQLLALFFSIQNGIPSDSPSSGAISRVVSHVRTYLPTASADNR
jgi:tagatose-6-phosphate ketose/aldose isomerase